MRKTHIFFVFSIVCFFCCFPVFAQRLNKQRALEMAASEYTKQVELQKPALLGTKAGQLW
jgi:uncharacterized membrane protein YbaN (DUF454 family)